MKKILISACFLGENVRYNAIIKPLHHEILKQWQQENRLVAQCPEVSGGLSTPRDPAEINSLSGQVITINNVNVSDAFTLGAEKTLQLCQTNNIQFALLKESSPSCGSHTIYDGSFTQTKINGQGITTRLLEAHHIRVYSEHTIEELIKQIHNNKQTLPIN